MNFAKSDSEFLCRHQSLVFNENLERGTASERADVLRNVIAHLTSSVKVSGQMEDEDIGALTREYTDMYADVVDSFDEQTGLNNYAEGALALCSGNKNESQKWKSSLTADIILGMPCMQKLVKHVQISKENLLPQQKKNDLLPSNLKENELLTKTQQTTNNKQPSNLQTRQTNINRNENLNQPRDRVINLYGNQSKLNSCSLPSYQENVTQKGHHPQGYVQDNCNDQLANRKPLFSSGAKNIPFEQYGSSSNVPVENKQREVRDRKRFHNERDNEQASTDERPNTAPNAFKTARQQLNIDNQRKYGGGATQNRGPVNTAAYGTGKKSLGTRRGLNSKFVPPVMNRDDEEQGNQAANTITRAVLKTGGSDGGSIAGKYEGLDEDKLKGIEPKMVELIMNEIMDNGLQLTWDDVAGLEFAKKTIKEIVVWPMLRPDIFTGLRGPPKGLLLFGPPGTGKTLIGKCIASQSKSTFFCISASSLTSKWVGEGEKMVRALFAVARSQQPAVVFIDEIDSLLTQRTDGENEASRRIKTEFLVQLDGASTSSEDRLLMIGATNRPQEIDEAARRRFVKRLYIPLPECAARKTIITNLLKHQSYQMGEEELDMICTKTDGFSGADMATLCREAALGPIRDMSFSDIEHIAADQVRPITFCDFKDALDHVRPSVSERDLDMYLDWNKTFGSGSR